MESSFQKRYYFIFLSPILGPLSTNALIPLFEQLRDNFVLPSVSLISLAFFVYMLPFAILQLFAGTFSDVIDKKRVVIWGYILFMAGILLTLTAVLLKNYYFFLLALFIQGLGFAFINPTILAILSIITPEEKEGLIMGIYNSSAGLGISGGSILAGLFANINWRLLFIFNPIITIIAFITFIYALKDCEALICRPYELTEKYQSSEKLGIKSHLNAVKQQLIENFKKEILFLGILGFFTFFSVISLTNTLNEQMSNNIENLSDIQIANTVSFILTINGLLSIIVSPFSGNILKKVKPLTMILLGFILMIAISVLQLSNSIVMFSIISFIIYLGSVCIWPALFKKSMDINPQAKGTNSAIINSLRFLGYSFVGIFYVIVGIPILYYLVFVFLITCIVMILLFKLNIRSKK
jgi:MFS family permease